MTLFISFRERSVAGSVVEPFVVEANVANPGSFRRLEPRHLAEHAAGRRLLFATHGFNVNQTDGISRLSRLEATLRTGVVTPVANGPTLGPEVVFVGIIWPGDFWVPAINYPFEGSTSTKCGRLLAAFCTRHLAGAADISFISHSLGARLILEAAGRLDVEPAMLCLTAAAVNADSLGNRFARAATRTGRVYNLSSRKDQVLKLAFPLGDFLGDLLNEDDGSHFTAALGYAGARPAGSPLGIVDRRIPDVQHYDHGSYLPSATPEAAPAPAWRNVATFMAEAFFGQVPHWP